MSLPTPSLDDRRFQDIVDEAKQLIPRYCPEWTDHNVSDPGVALIELFAWMTDLTLYRLNRVPDRLYAKFLELMGIALQEAAPARTRLTFWLSAPQEDVVRIPARTQVGTQRTEQDEAIVFLTDSELTIVPPRLEACLTSTGGSYEDHWDDLRLDAFEVRTFPSAVPDDAVYLGFADPLGGNVIRLDVTARIEGRGVDPDDPPWAWEVWDGDSWIPATVLSDTTSGLNTDGSIELALPAAHEPLILGPTRSHWLRCRMTMPREDQEAYDQSPVVQTCVPVGLGGSVAAHHADPVPGELLGRSDGQPGQVFRAQRTPVLPRTADEHVVERTADGEERAWTEVEDFGRSSPDDRHFTWEGATGEIRFGPQVRERDGSWRQFGAVPGADSELRLTGYRSGGGQIGNVARGRLRVPKSTIPFIRHVENLEPARGGVDPESVAEAKARGPMWLRSGQRAVTTGDFERLTLESSPLVMRARCVPPAEPGAPIDVLVVPRLDIPPTDLELDDLALPDDLIDRVSAHLDERRILTSTVRLRTPTYQGVTVVARVVAAPGARDEQVRERAVEALYGFVNPLIGGPGGTGWPFGRGLNVGEVFALLSSLDGVVGVEEVRLFLADLAAPGGGERRDAGQAVRLPPDSLLASFQHQVLVRA